MIECGVDQDDNIRLLIEKYLKQFALTDLEYKKFYKEWEYWSSARTLEEIEREFIERTKGLNNNGH